MTIVVLCSFLRHKCCFYLGSVPFGVGVGPFWCWGRSLLVLGSVPFVVGVGPFCCRGRSLLLSGSVPFCVGVGPFCCRGRSSFWLGSVLNQTNINCFVIPRKRPNERSECDLEQPTY